MMSGGGGGGYAEVAIEICKPAVALGGETPWRPDTSTMGYGFPSGKTERQSISVGANRLPLSVFIIPTALSKSPLARGESACHRRVLQ